MWDNSKETARYLKKNQTQAEKVFWELIRNRRFEGIKFYRQYPIRFESEGQKRFFVVDFYCHKTKTVFEIDGGIHEKTKGYDEMREKILKSLKYKLVRFSKWRSSVSKRKIFRKTKKTFF